MLGCAAHRTPQPTAPLEAPSGGDQTLILISLDGFRWDYLDLVETPHLNALADAGVRAEGLIPVFPSKTFPCHYSIATGLYPANHGIVSNDMFDPELEAEFHLRDRDTVTDTRWWWGEPIWVSAEKQGVRAAAMFWPGTEGEIAGERPTFWKPYDGDFPYEKRVETVLGWLDLPSAERPRMITLYFQDPNDTSHDHGPEAPETFAAVREVDSRVGDLVAGVRERGLDDQVNYIVVSDHGMAEVDRERIIILDDLVELEVDEVFQEGAMLQILPREGRQEEIFTALDGAHPHLAVYRPGEAPERFHLGAGSRVPPILGVPDVGWEVMTRQGWEGWGKRLKGDHGQDPADPRMHGLFVASGPAFRAELEIGRFESVEIYNLMAAVLGLEPAPNDGRPDRLEHLLVGSNGR